MLEMRAIVIQVQGEDASVQPLGDGGCGHCNSTGGCGGSSLSKMFCSSKPRHFKVRNEAHAKVGDEVRVSLPDGVLFRGAIKMYVLPLLLLMVGGGCGVALAGATGMQDAYAAAGALTGLLLGFAFARFSTFRVGQAVASSIVSSRSGF